MSGESLFTTHHSTTHHSTTHHSTQSNGRSFPRPGCMLAHGLVAGRLLLRDMVEEIVILGNFRHGRPIRGRFRDGYFRCRLVAADGRRHLLPDRGRAWRWLGLAHFLGRNKRHLVLDLAGEYRWRPVHGFPGQDRHHLPHRAGNLGGTLVPKLLFGIIARRGRQSWGRGRRLLFLHLKNRPAHRIGTAHGPAEQVRFHLIPALTVRTDDRNMGHLAAVLHLGVTGNYFTTKIGNWETTGGVCGSLLAPMFHPSPKCFRELDRVFQIRTISP